MRRDEGVVYTSFQSYTHVGSGHKLNPLELVWIEFGHSADRFARDTGFKGNFSYRHCRISLDAFIEELAVISGVDCALSAAARKATRVAELLEPFDGPLVIWRLDAKLSRNVAVALSLLM